MLYQTLVMNKILKVLKFRKIGTLERCQHLVPDLIRRYYVPKELRRDVYFMILKKYFHNLREEEIKRLLDEAYPTEQFGFYIRHGQTNEKLKMEKIA
jgi:hypothetical protein